MKHRHIALDGTANMRDLGGILTRCGRKTRFNKVFRSGLLSRLSHSDWSKLALLNITTICDFRSEMEVVKDPTNLPDFGAFQIIEIPITPGSFKESYRRLKETKDSESIELLVKEMVCSTYQDMAVDCVSEFAQFIRQIQKLPPEGALLFHCTAGKDRTGFAAAILLTCLNVERELIEQEYSLTERYYIPEMEIKNALERNPFLAEVELDEELLVPMFGASKHFISASFDAIDKHWGNIDYYIRDGLGLGDDARKHLQELLVEDGS